MPPHVRPPKRRDYIRELQSLDEPIKQRVLIAASAITMMLVVYIWIGYFNSIVMGGPTQLADQSASVQAGAVPSAITGDDRDLGGNNAERAGVLADAWRRHRLALSWCGQRL